MADKASLSKRLKAGWESRSACPLTFEYSASRNEYATCSRCGFTGGIQRVIVPVWLP